MSFSGPPNKRLRQSCLSFVPVKTGSYVTGMLEKVCNVAYNELKVTCTAENVAMDGNCLFSSLALQLRRYGADAGRQVREEVVEYMESNREVIQDVMDAEQCDKYVRRMRQDGIFGDGIALSAAARRYNRPVVIFSPESPSPVQRIDLPLRDGDERKPPMYLGLFSEHYVSVRPSQQCSAAATLDTEQQVEVTGKRCPDECGDVAEHTDSQWLLQTDDCPRVSSSASCDAVVTCVDNVATVYDIGNFVDRTAEIDDFTRYSILESHWKPPVGFRFPFSVHRKQGKEERRYLSQSHLQKYPWLIFSPSRNGLFCKFCPLFVSGAVGGLNRSIPLQQLVTRPLSSYAKLLGHTGDLEKHCQSQYHIDAVLTGSDFLSTFRSPARNILNQVSNQRAAQVRENHERLKPIVDTIIFLGRQNIPLRGHRDDGCLLNVADEGSVNEGNFRELLRFRVNAGDEALAGHLRNATARATYISKTVQNELIECCGSIILSHIVQRVSNSRVFSILFDETTDLSHTSQLSIAVRYVHEGAVREDFLGFIDPHAEVYGDHCSDGKDVSTTSSAGSCHHETVADSQSEYLSCALNTAADMPEPKLTGSVLGDLVVKTMDRMGINKDHCVGIGTDGCSVMVSEVRGAVSTIQKVAPQAMRCPCFNHALNLSLAKSATVQTVRNAVGTIKEVVVFFTSSAKRNFVLKRTAGRQLQSLCETRWIERHDAVLLFCRELSNVVNALTTIAGWDDSESATKANALVHAICCPEFVATIFSLSDVLSVTMPVSKKLQQAHIEFTDAASVINDALSVLQKRRADCEYFDEVFGSACEAMQTLDVAVTVPRTTGRQTKRANPPAATPAEYYRRAVYFPLLDCIISDLQSRFSDGTLDTLSELACFIPAHMLSDSVTAIINVDHVMKTYGSCLAAPVDKLMLRAETDLWRQKWARMKAANPDETIPSTAIDALQHCDSQTFPIISACLMILLTLPVSTAGVERSFSTLRRVKTWLRSRMGEKRLTGLALLNIHRDIPVSAENVIDKFAKTKKRYWDLAI